jgi:transposase, IS5 family
VMKSYKNINDPQRSFVTAYVEKHSQKNQFFNDINKMINWKTIDNELKKVYKKGLKERGAKAYSPLLLFKMQLISIWYDLSDIQTESMVNDSLSAIKFCDLTIEDDVPGPSTLSRFRRELIRKKAYEKLLDQVNNQLTNHSLEVKKGRSKVDAKLTAI